MHPAPAVFPMLGADELEALAADIAANGLRYPIVLDATGGLLVDGRNGLEASGWSGLSRTTRFVGRYRIEAYVVSANLHRRNLTKGQAAISLAMIYPGG